MENALIDRVKSQVNNMKTWTDEMQVQMALGKAEARELMEKERKNLTRYFNAQKKEFDQKQTTSLDSRKSFLACVQNLETSLYNEIPTDAEGYDEYKVFVLSNIYKMEEELRQNHPTASVSIQDKLESFKAKMDAFRVNLALHDKDDPEKVERLRNEFTSRLAEIRTLLDNQEAEQTQLDQFVEDISESYNYLKRAIADLSIK